MEICTSDRTVIDQAILLDQDDFEDAVEIVCGIKLGLDAITTRDIDEFVDSVSSALSSNDLRNQIEGTQNCAFVTNSFKVARLEVLNSLSPKLRRSDDRWNTQFQN
jgi:hypothetical protein